MIFKAQLTQKENGEWQIISYANRLIPLSIHRKLNNAVHDVIDRVNGKTDWKQYYIRFTHNGKTYHQVDSEGSTCEGCCFYNYPLGCVHPHRDDGTKGSCEGRIYKED